MNAGRADSYFVPFGISNMKAKFLLKMCALKNSILWESSALDNDNSYVYCRQIIFSRIFCLNVNNSAKINTLQCAALLYIIQQLILPLLTV